MEKKETFYKTIERHIGNLGFKGLLKVIKAKIIKETILTKVNREDCKFPFFLRVASSDVRVYREVFIKKEYEFLVKSSPKVIIDAGANIGLTSIYFANKYPKAKIIAIEPEKNNFAMLKKNTTSYFNIFPLQSALWNKNEKINLIDPNDGNWGFQVNGKRSKIEKGVIFDKTNGITINTIMKDFNLKKIDILKIDIEGAEREVFQDPSSWIKKVNSIVIELHNNLKPGCSRNFYNSTNDFDNEWQLREVVYLSKNNYLTK